MPHTHASPLRTPSPQQHEIVELKKKAGVKVGPGQGAQSGSKGFSGPTTSIHAFACWLPCLTGCTPLASLPSPHRCLHPSSLTTSLTASWTRGTCASWLRPTRRSTSATSCSSPRTPGSSCAWASTPCSGGFRALGQFRGPKEAQGEPDVFPLTYTSFPFVKQQARWSKPLTCRCLPLHPHTHPTPAPGTSPVP
jgi:hypothetical protein